MNRESSSKKRWNKKNDENEDGFSKPKRRPSKNKLKNKKHWLDQINEDYEIEEMYYKSDSEEDLDLYTD